MFLAADFPDKQTTSQALVDLRAKGFTPADLAVFSDSPVEFSRDVLPRRSHMSLAVVTGAVTACLLTVGFVYFTQYNYPLTTGAMPIFSFWSTGVVFYELTMFGAIVTSLFWFLRESGLLRRRRGVLVPVVTPGVISLRVECNSDRADDVRKSLDATGARNVRALERGR